MHGGTPGERLRAAREARGLTVEEVAEATKISAAHVQALEADRLDAIPAGPYADAYRKALHRFLAPPDATVPQPRPERPPADEGWATVEGFELPGEPAAPLRTVRVLAVTSVLALVAIFLGAVWPQGDEPARGVVPAAPVTGQELSVRAERNTRIRVLLDGAPHVDRRVAGGDTLTFRAEEPMGHIPQRRLHRLVSSTPIFAVVGSRIGLTAEV